MVEEKIITLRLQMTLRSAFSLLTAFFICWNPKELGSETLTMTTYYPAPYASYSQLLTTGQTVLARDGPDSKVGIGMIPDATSPTLSVAANANGAAYFNEGAVTGDYVLAMGAVYGNAYGSGERGAVIYNSDHPSEAALMLVGNDYSGTKQVKIQDDLGVSGDLEVKGYIRKLCYQKYYSDLMGATSCNSSKDYVFSHYGNGEFRHKGMITGVAGWPNYLKGDGQDWSGWMLCCRIN